MQSNGRGLLEFTLSSVIFGFSYMFSSLGFKWTTPITFLAVRFVLAFIFINLLVLTGHLKVSLKGKPVYKLILLGFIQPVLGFLCDNYGTYYTSSSFAGSTVALAPVVALLMGVFIVHERITPIQVIGSALAVLGAVILNMDNSGGANSVKGVLLLLAAIVSGRAYLIMSKSFSDLFTSTERSYVQLGIGAVAFSVIAWVTAGKEGIDFGFVKHPEFWVSALYLSALSSVATYLLINHSIESISNTQSAILSMLIPVISVVAGVCILHENFTVRQAVGAAIILVSVYMATRPEKTETSM